MCVCADELIIDSVTCFMVEIGRIQALTMIRSSSTVWLSPLTSSTGIFLFLYAGKPLRRKIKKFTLIFTDIKSNLFLLVPCLKKKKKKKRSQWILHF